MSELQFRSVTTHTIRLLEASENRLPVCLQRKGNITALLVTEN